MPMLVLLAALGLSLAGCGGGDSGSDAARTTTGAVPSTGGSGTSSSVDAPTTADQERCPAVPQPPGAKDVVTMPSGDVDGDGAADTLRSYGIGDGWHLQVVLAGGGGAELALTSSGAGAMGAVGTADVDGDGRDEVWALTGSGASASIVGLVRFDACTLSRVTFVNGEPADFPVGGSVGAAAGLECAAGADPDTDLTAYTASSSDGSHHAVTVTEYSLEGSTVVVQASTSTSAQAGDAAFARYTGFTCDDLQL
jgi:hypothetical protein